MPYLPREGAAGKQVVQVLGNLVAKSTHLVVTVSRPASVLHGEPNENLDAKSRPSPPCKPPIRVQSRALNECEVAILPCIGRILSTATVARPDQLSGRSGAVYARARLPAVGPPGQGHHGCHVPMRALASSRPLSDLDGGAWPQERRVGGDLGDGLAVHSMISPKPAILAVTQCPSGGGSEDFPGF